MTCPAQTQQSARRSARAAAARTAVDAAPTPSARRPAPARIPATVFSATANRTSDVFPPARSGRVADSPTHRPAETEDPHAEHPTLLAARYACDIPAANTSAEAH